MIHRFIRPLAIVLALSLLTYGVALAKGPPSKVTISGPSLAGEVEVTDPDLLQAFSFFQFARVGQTIEPPLKPGEGYLVTRYVQDRGNLRAWDQAIYYPSSKGELGMIFLEGLVGPSRSQFDGHWYRASADGDAAMREILAEHEASAARGTAWAALYAPTSRAVALALFAFLALVGAVVGTRRGLRRVSFL
jgi:hypothetical protein